MTTTSGVLFIIALAKATNTSDPPIARAGFFTAWRSTMRINAFNAPVRTNAPTMMNIAAIVHGAGFAKAMTASSYDNTPVTSNVDTPINATTSVG